MMTRSWILHLKSEKRKKGSRDPQLATDAELDYTDAAEILFLLEKLP
jgi:hypothetical protein